MRLESIRRSQLGMAMRLNGDEDDETTPSTVPTANGG